MEEKKVVKLTNKSFFLRQHIATRTEILYEDLRLHLCEVSEQINKDPVLYTPQQRNTIQKATARMNIGAVSVEEVLDLIEQEFPDYMQIIIDRIETIENNIQDLTQREYSFSNTTEVHIIHNLNRYPTVKILIGIEQVLAPIEHMINKNEFKVRFSKPLTGLIIYE